MFPNGTRKGVHIRVAWDRILLGWNFNDICGLAFQLPAGPRILFIYLICLFVCFLLPSFPFPSGIHIWVFLTFSHGHTHTNKHIERFFLTKMISYYTHCNVICFLKCTVLWNHLDWYLTICELEVVVSKGGNSTRESLFFSSTWLPRINRALTKDIFSIN